ncbi:MAG: hypothetical protein K0R02_365 [Rickettsiaceae bacterium]|nr:hypothetical protein [Rickettsiaceae bacterium]
MNFIGRFSIIKYLIKSQKLYKEILDLQELVTIAHNNFGKENTLKDLYKNLEKKTDNMKNLLVKNASASQEIFFILNNKKLAPDVEEIKKDKETEWMKVICNYNLAASKFAFIKDSYKALNETLDNPFDSFVKSTSLVACTLNSLKPANEDFIDKVKKFDISLAKLEEFLSLKNCEKEILSKNSACFDETHISSHNEAGKMKDDNVGYSDYIGGIFFASLALSSIIMGAVEDQYLDSEE